MITVTLPWPPSALSPNARTHWAQKSKQAKAYRMSCFVLCIEAGVRDKAFAGQGPITLDIQFIEPDKRKRDMDNMLASMKNGIDGIADALGLNDRRFVFRISRSEEVGGYIKVLITLGEVA